MIMFCFYKATPNLCCPFHPFLRPLPYSRRDLSGHRPGADFLLFLENPPGDLAHGLLSLAFLLLPADSNFCSISTQLTEWFWVQFAATTLLWPVEFSLPGSLSFHTPPQSLATPTGMLINNWMMSPNGPCIVSSSSKLTRSNRMSRRWCLQEEI